MGRWFAPVVCSDLPSSGGRGGTGGGTISCGVDSCGLGLCSCRATTGGSRAKIFCNMEQNSGRLDLYTLVSLFKFSPRKNNAATHSFIYSLWRTHIFSPSRQVGVIYSSLPTYILAGPDNHVIRRRDEADGRSARIFLGYP